MPYILVPDPEGTVWDHNIQFWVDLPPSPWKRPVPGVSKKGSYYEYTHPDQLKYQNLVRTIFYDYCKTNGKVFDYPFDGVMILTCHSFFPRPKKYEKMYHPCDLNKDWDNLGKNICDALQSRVKIRLADPDPVTKKKSKWIRRFGAYVNDKDVILGTSGKHWAQTSNGVGTFVDINFYRRTLEPRKISK
jgi:Holliday junction resolvase RusA-like endonuclease